ncbi:MAG: S-layer homology domain-containing protein [Candidatus Abawacabacteria bacterium]|nr:S-layer homology domain-containing protein [Candidatus Abawacabacteria bacterium]
MSLRKCIVASILLFGSVIPAHAMVYPDVDYSHPYIRGIVAMTDAKLVKGYEDNLFRPDRGLSRIEALKIVLNSANIPYNNYSNTQYVAPPVDTHGNVLPMPTSPVSAHKGVSFPDIPVDSWYAPYVNAGENLEIIHGYPDGLFRPQTFVTRIEAYKMLFRAFDTLSDAPVEGEDWFLPYVQYAANHNLANFTEDPFTNLDALGDVIPRGEFTDLAFRLKSITPASSGSRFNPSMSYPTITIPTSSQINSDKFGRTSNDAKEVDSDNHYQKVKNKDLFVYTARNFEEAKAVARAKFKKDITIEGIELARKNYAAMAYPFDRTFWHTPFETSGLTYEQWYALKATTMLQEGYMKDKSL